MNYKDKTKDELIKELQNLQQEYDSLKTSYINDSTAHLKMEETIHQSEKQYQTLAENTSLVIARLDRTFHHLYVNQAAFRVTGIQPEEYIGKTHRELGYPSEQCDFWEAAIDKVFTTGKSIQESVVFKGIPGEMFLDWRLYPEFDVSGNVVSVLSNVHDITKLKQAEIALLASKEQFNTIAESALVGIYILQNGKYTYVNPAMAKIFGYSIAEMTGKNPLEIIVQPSDHEMVGENIRRRITGELKTMQYEVRCRHKDGSTLLIEVYGSRIEMNGSPVLIGTLIDITERKKTEEKLTQAIEWQKSIFDGSLDAIFISDENSVLIVVNNAACELTGYSKEQLLKMRIPVLHDELDLEAYRKYHKRIFKGEKILSEAKILRRDGVKVDAEFNNSRISISGKYYMHTTARDVTERKKSDRELFEFSERYRLLLENSGLGIGYYGLDGKILMFNQQAIINLGGKAEDYIGKNVTAVFGKEAGQIYIDRFKLVSASEKPLKYEDYVNLDGKPSWYMSTHTRIVDKNGNVDGIQVIADNITQKKIAENTILEKNANLTAIFENSKDMIASRDKKNCLVAFNTPFKEIVRKLYNAEAIPGLNTLKYLKKKDEIKWNRILNDVLNGKVYKSEFDWDFGNGDIRTYTISYQPIILNGEIIGTLETNRDITESKRADNKIREGYLYARSLIEASLDPLVTINIDGKITDVNVATEKITGIKRENLIGSDFADYFENPDKAKTGYKTVFSEGIVKDYPLTVLHKSGRRINVLYNATLFKNEYGEVQGVFAAARDITKLKKTEEELRKSKKMLEKLNQHLVEVRENERNEIALNLHDDLGQKLTAINLDIAWLKSRIGVQSKPVREKFEEMSSMIKETIESIKETSALLRPAMLFDLGLVPAIKWQLGIFEKQSGIKCNFYFRPEEFLLEDRLSLILYRILQESMTNIARHSGASKADIHLYVLKNKIELIIKDDGGGIEKNKVNSFKSLGIAGIIERVKSVNGKINIVGIPGSGTIISVEIPLLKVKSND